TYPATGSALRPYSVSPRRNDQIRGPTPTKYSGAFILNRLAKYRCPASCSEIEASRAMMKRTMPSHPSTAKSDIYGLPLARSDSRDLSRLLPRPAVGREHRLDGQLPAVRLVGLDDPLNRVDDTQEREPVVEEGGHAFLVRR